jgi:hypothetical protein
LKCDDEVTWKEHWRRVFNLGIALIVNNKEFPGFPMLSRPGSDYDVQKLRILFQQMDYSVVIKEDLNAKVKYCVCLHSA